MSTTPRTDEIYGPHAHAERRVGHGAEKLCRQLEEELAFIRRCCRVVYYPPDGSCPIEHAPGAGKDQLDEILRRQEPAMIPGGRGEV